jgi:predicted RNA-binding Zn-ribbon protein involved in translation (DUF1610 family)
MIDWIAHLQRQIAFSRGTFGPGTRREGVLDHMTKEIGEVRSGDGDPKEWVDLVILGLDGLWREVKFGGRFGNPSHDDTAEIAIGMILEKQSKNEERDWPNWREMPADKAIEHVRTAPAPDPATLRQISNASGFTGGPCPECGNFTLVRNGTCLKCNTCGSTTGCS